MGILEHSEPVGGKVDLHQVSEATDLLRKGEADHVVEAVENGELLCGVWRVGRARGEHSARPEEPNNGVSQSTANEVCGGDMMMTQW